MVFISAVPLLGSLPETLIEVPASMMPLFGRTQYRRGAVVFTLKHTFRSVGFESLRVVVTTSENGPVWVNMRRSEESWVEMME